MNTPPSVHVRELCPRKRRLLEELNRRGGGYNARMIDMEPVLYKKLENVDLELSGGYCRRSFKLYVWQLSPSGYPQYIRERFEISSSDISKAADRLLEIERTVSR